uniref:Adaptin_N domain-containing protein n=1 Tax=Angiostrongylus cantonensis TaxID=6313 RepID=A0A0K0DQ47_ANGCA
MIDSNEQLQKFTDNNLLRLIEAADSTPKAVEKVREILSHYNRRVKGNSVITFPIRDLISMVKNKGSVAAHLSFVYLRFSSANFGEEQHLELLSYIFHLLPLKLADSGQCAECVGTSLSFCLVIQLLGLSVPAFMIIAQRENHTWPALSFSTDVQLLVLRFFQCIIVFSVDAPDVVNATCAALKRGDKVLTPVLTSEEYIMIAEKVYSRVDSIVQVKLRIIKLLVSGLFDYHTVFSILVLALAQNIDEVTSAAETALKKVDTRACLDSRIVIDELMAAYLGCTTPSKSVIGRSCSLSPANIIMKRKILMYLVRSPVAAVAYMNNLKVYLLDIFYTYTCKYVYMYLWHICAYYILSL